MVYLEETKEKIAQYVEEGHHDNWATVLLREPKIIRRIE